MTSEYKGAGELLARTANFIGDHLNLYLTSGGKDGHILEYSHVGIPAYLGALLLETYGRKSGKRFVAPLIYGYYNQEWVIIGSKGGAEEHPAWYLNLRERDEVCFQVGTQAFRASWREPEGAERQAVWDYMVGIFPNYTTYQTAVTRAIPVVMMRPIEPVPVFTAE
ncbi:MAG: nitroreductase family deazaflavin-dependent oxidoreductase [Rhizobiaceae bacterium]|nr:MAG: nitroreductase family deazaflavin-dependent oxidoreductase [Rhizobiaceae bacterium]